VPQTAFLDGILTRTGRDLTPILRGIAYSVTVGMENRTMELMRYMEGLDSWTAFPSALQGLRLSTASSVSLLLFSRNPIQDLAEMAAFIGVFKSAGGGMEKLAAASPYPSQRWIRCLMDEGIGGIYYASSRLDGNPFRIAGTDLVRIPENICPKLHIRSFDGRPMCVCGGRFDLLVLGRRQFSARCFDHWTECQWYASAAGVAMAAAR